MIILVLFCVSLCTELMIVELLTSKPCSSVEGGSPKNPLSSSPTENASANERLAVAPLFGRLAVRFQQGTFGIEQCTSETSAKLNAWRVRTAGLI